jgi:hypothetical protein
MEYKGTHNYYREHFYGQHKKYISQGYPILAAIWDVKLYAYLQNVLTHRKIWFDCVANLIYFLKKKPNFDDRGETPKLYFDHTILRKKSINFPNSSY